MIAGTAFRLAEIDRVWPQFRARAARSHTTAEMIEQHLKACRNGEALCLVCDDGLVIVTLEIERNGRITCMVLLAVSNGAFNAFARYEEQMLAIARDLEADDLAFCTDRPAWRRMLGAAWRKAGECTFSRSIR